MKVKELKALVENCDENLNVYFADTNQSCVAIVDGSVSNDHECVYLFTRQEFPDGWFDKNHEIRWVNGKAVIPAPDAEETEEILVSDEKLGLDELPLEMTFHDGYACDKYGNIMKYPKVCDLTDEQLEEIDRYTGGRVSDSGVVTPNDVCLLFGELFDFGIMEHGSHGDALVDEINIKWLKFHDKFKPILVALYERDIDEITDSDAFQIPSWLNTEECAEGKFSGDWDGYHKMALADMTTRWDEFANNYLMHIADDQDLEAIIKFVRYDVCEDERHS